MHNFARQGAGKHKREVRIYILICIHPLYPGTLTTRHQLAIMRDNFRCGEDMPMPQPLPQEPAAVFLAIMAVVLIAPLLSRFARLPSIVGLILGGTLVGRYGLNLLATDPTIEQSGSMKRACPG
jgi:hypothetical protein